MNAQERYEKFVLPDDVAKVSVVSDTKIANAVSITVEREDHTVGNLLRHQLHRGHRRQLCARMLWQLRVRRRIDVRTRRLGRRRILQAHQCLRRGRGSRVRPARCVRAHRILPARLLYVRLQLQRRILSDGTRLRAVDRLSRVCAVRGDAAHLAGGPGLQLCERLQARRASCSLTECVRGYRVRRVSGALPNFSDTAQEPPRFAGALLAHTSPRGLHWTRRRS